MDGGQGLFRLGPMKHFVFPTVQQADAFANELKTQGLVREDTRQHAYTQGQTEGFAGRSTGTQYTTDHYVSGTYDADRDGSSVGDEALKGTAVGAATGAAAGLAGAALAGATAATVATGGLAAPLIGLTLLGSGVGAAVGAAGEAAREADDAAYYDTYDTHDTHYSTLSETYQGGGRAVAVDDNVDAAAVMAAAQKHGGRQVG
ncbi:hypothetical protein Deipr_1536 [Deinococcus proteolyticus MRP]|uniref:Uncharacterized protein n=2 Tax=Deinococcaceae TaxID=183710 RepID=F0RK28_DEIPM|nr:hypothetical protein Deipr_1536 [Deinococcus proteolyticus MRP]